LFSQVTASNVPGRSLGLPASTAASTNRLPRVIQAQKRQVEPKHTIVIEKVPNPNQLNLQTKIRSWDADLIPMINSAKVVSNGNLFIEAKEESLLQDMTSKLEAILPQIGPDVTLRPMVKQGPTTNSAIVFNVPSSYTKEIINEQAKIELPSITDITDLKKPTSTASRRPIKVTLANAREFSHLLSYGLKIGWEIFNADQWLKCFKCQRFGHNATVCHSKPRCINCGDDHQKEGRCQRQTKCCNCQGNHLANDKKCPTRKETMILNASARLSTQQHHG
jgi:hypothetical protein